MRAGIAATSKSNLAASPNSPVGPRAESAMRRSTASNEQAAHQAAQPDKSTVICGSRIVHGEHVKRFDFDRAIADEKSEVGRVGAGQTFGDSSDQIGMADGCEGF